MSSQENLFRTIKRNPAKRYQPIIKEDLEIGYDYIPSLKETEQFKELKSKFGHVPMKKESQKIRRIMSDKGLSKSEVMNNSHYMEIVKDVNKASVLEDYEVLFLDIAKAVMKEKNLPIWNDEVIESIKDKVRHNIDKYLNENPYYDHCECCGYNENTYSFSDFVYFGTSLRVIPEVYIWRNIIELNRNLFLKKYMILAKKRKNKHK
ncbi:hypothetical protein ACTOJ1_005451 [Shigella flexneri]